MKWAESGASADSIGVLWRGRRPNKLFGWGCDNVLFPNADFSSFISRVADTVALIIVDNLQKC